jgi:hypothetical protein
VANGVLVLVGGGRLTPGLFFRMLVPPGLYVEAPVEPGGKPHPGLRRAWVYGFQKLAAQVSGAGSAGFEALLEATDDPAEASFASPAERAARTTVFAATAEDLPECETPGLALRLWGVPVGLHFDADKLLTWRDQLWAEAVSEYRKEDASWTLTPAEEERRGRSLGELGEPDEWEAPILEFMREHDSPRIEDVLDDLFPPDVSEEVEAEGYNLNEIASSSDPDALVERTWGQSEVLRAARVLRSLGYVSVRIRKDGLRTVVWVAATQAAVQAETKPAKAKKA